MANYRHTRFIPWLAWWGLLISIIGGTAAYLLHTFETDPAARPIVTLVVAITVIAAGTCFIIATADWWIRH